MLRHLARKERGSVAQKPTKVHSISGLLLGLLLLTGCQSNPSQPESHSSSGETPLRYRARLHTELGVGYYSRGQPVISLEELNNAIKLDPSYALPYSVLGLVYNSLKEIALAESSFQKAIELAPQDPEIRNNYGWFLCANKKEKSALEQFEVAIHNPLYQTPEMALLNAGRCAALTSEYAIAEEYYQQALKKSPNLGQAHQGLVELAYRKGNLQEAREHLAGMRNLSNPPSEALWLGYCVAKKLDDKESQESYAAQLRKRYPDAPETQKLAAGSCS